MEIEEFVQSTLEQIINGVKKVDEKDVSNHEVLLDRAAGVEFDIALTAESTQESNAKGGLKIHIANADAGKTASNKESTTSRIKFKVYP